MSIVKNILIDFLSSMIEPYKALYKSISTFTKQTFCNHDYRFWKMRMVVDNQNSSLKHLHGNEMVKWRKCDKCGKKQELSMIPGEWHWKTTYNNLPDSTNVIDVEIRQLGEETKSEKRDRLINQILK